MLHKHCLTQWPTHIALFGSTGHTPDRIVSYLLRIHLLATFRTKSTWWWPFNHVKHWIVDYGIRRLLRPYRRSRTGLKLLQQIKKIARIITNASIIPNRRTSITQPIKRCLVLLAPPPIKDKNYMDRICWSLANVKSIHGKIDEVQMELHRHIVDLLVITESWLMKDDHVTSNVQPDWLDIISIPRNSGSGGWWDMPSLQNLQH